ncbi:hypothetical protein ACIHFC_36010 [Streptomyces sp. NPDC052013]|uniref:hypothetical protein n=1 Tax=Streptomyces sp. NPDC052013 TaxID=3365679 RepID=UPI0037D1155E
MRRARMRRWAGAAVGQAAAALTLVGCGISETDVIEAGGPATVEAFLVRGEDMLLFFRSPDGGVVPVIRTAEDSAGFGSGYELPDTDTAASVTPEKTIVALLDGPTKADRSAGLSTLLPPIAAGAKVTVHLPEDGLVTARVPLALQGLDKTALRQLVCTVAYSADPDGRVRVRMTGQEGVSTSATCGLDPGSDAPPGRFETSSLRTGGRHGVVGVI